MIRTNLSLAFASIRGAKIRTLLTLVAVIIGVWSFTVVTTTVDGLKNAAGSEIADFGGNLVVVNSGKLFSEDDTGNKTINTAAAAIVIPTLTEKDLKDIQKNVDGIKSIAPQAIVSATGEISRGDKTLEGALIIGTNEDYPAAFNQIVATGDFLTEEKKEGDLIVLGSGVVEELYGGEVGLGTRIEYRGQKFTVIGAMEEYSSALGALSSVDLNNAILMSTTSAAKISDASVLISEIDIQFEEEVDTDSAKKQIEEILLENHRGEEDFTVSTEEELNELIDSLFGIIKQAGQFLAYIMLFVASIVILLIMLITVRERTREIGLRKSIGATNSNILTQFLIEALTLSWLGSAIGVGLGYASSFLIKRFVDVTPAYSLDTLILLVSIATAVGAIAGVVPAGMAARKNPVDSLRDE